MKNKLLISLNVLVIVLEIIGFIFSVYEFGFNVFIYYTQYSNLLALISSALLIYSLTKNNYSKKIRFLRYMTVHMLALTFIVVTFVLIPLIGKEGYKMLVSGSMLYHHFLCPLLVFTSFMFLEKGCPITSKDPLYVLIPTCAYGIVIITLNILKVIDGPYPFLQMYSLPLYLTIPLLSLVIFIAFILGYIVFKLSKNRISN